jgi:branched-chain amino acid aminotransferase
MAEGVKKSDKIWLDGKFVPWNEANVHILTHTLHYGLGVFEGIRCYKQAQGGSALFRLQDHLERLYESAHICLIEMPLPRTVIEAAVVESFRVNRLAEGYARPIAFMGDGAMGLGAINPTRVAIVVWPWAAYLGEDGVKRGIRAKVASLCRMTFNASMVRGKITGQYVNSILAKREAVLAGYDEAILLDYQGLIAEGSGENIFIVRKGVLYTPPLTAPILAGVTRDSVIAIARERGMPVEERGFTRDTLYNAEEAFFCGTAAEITPIREVDNRQIGSGEPGPTTRALQDSFQKLTRGEFPRFREWLTPV